MDSISQAVLGAGVAEVAVGKKIGNKAILVGIALGTVPDLDVFFTHGMEVADGLLAHRGISHSILFNLLLSPLIGFVLKKIFHKYDISFLKWTISAWLVLMTHVLLDCFTNYGTGILEPFSHKRIEWGTIAIVDVFYTIPFLIIMAVLMFFKRHSKLRIYLGRIAVSVSTLYLLSTTVTKMHINSVFKKQLVSQEITYERYKTVPLPLTNFLWMCVAETDSSFYTGYYSVFDKKKDIGFFKTNKNHDLADLNSRQAKKLIRFSKNWYALESKENKIVFNDVRFGRLGFSGQDPFLFSYELKHGKKGLSIKEYNQTYQGEGAFNSFIKRIFGISESK